MRVFSGAPLWAELSFARMSNSMSFHSLSRKIYHWVAFHCSVL